MMRQSEIAPAPYSNAVPLDMNHTRSAASCPFPENAEALMRDFATVTGADGVTLWRAEDGALVAIANPLEPSMVGQRQPLDRGLISRVYLTGQAILEQMLQENPGHDRSIDTSMGTRGTAMMAAPLEAGEGDDGGVISAVLLEHHQGPADFSLHGLEQLAALARTLSSGWTRP
jgi:phage tail protein X